MSVDFLQVNYLQALHTPALSPSLSHRHTRTRPFIQTHTHTHTHTHRMNMEQYLGDAYSIRLSGSVSLAFSLLPSESVC